MTTMRAMGVTAAVAAALVIPAVAATPAFARGAGGHDVAGPGGRPGVEATGSCTGGGTWELKAKTDDGGLEVEFEVDTNVAGQVFNVRVTDGPTVVFAGKQTTAGRSGSFSVERLTADRVGRDTVKAVAKRPGVTCTGTVRI
jgi:hypothetical protein